MQSLIDKLKTGDGAIAAMLWIGLGLVLLIVVVVFAAWLIRVLRPTLNMSGAPSRTGRVQRLAVTDAFPLDRDGRKLVIVRRDNVEHLLLIGGPNDVLVEANFMRSDRARVGKADPAGDGFDPSLDAATLAPPVPQRPQAPPPAMVQQASVAPPVPAPRPAPVMRPPVQPAAATPRTQPVAAPAPRPQAEPASATKTVEFDLEFEQAMRAIEAQVPAASNPITPNPSASRPAPLPQAPLPPAAPQYTPAPQVSPAPRSEPMSEMARRLSEVLQKPIAPPRTAAPVMQPRPQMPAAQTPSAPAPPPATAKPSTEVEMDLLEEEMARLLGRPVAPGKPGGA